MKIPKYTNIQLTLNMRNKNEFRTTVYLRQELIKETIKSIHEDLFNGFGSDPLNVPVNNEDIKTNNAIVFTGLNNVKS